MSKRQIRYRPNRRATPLDATAWGPYVKLACALALLAAFALFVVIWLVPRLTERFRNGALFPWNATPAPVTAEPTSTPHPVTSNSIRTLTFSDELLVDAIADPSVYAGKLLFVTGQNAEAPDRLIECDLESGKAVELKTHIENDALRMPHQSAAYLLYFDAFSTGGGDVRMRDKGTGTEQTLLRVRYGVPRLCLEAAFLLLSERTAETEYRLSAIDLATRDTVTLALFESAQYGASASALASGQVLYADANPDDETVSVIQSVRLDTGDSWTFEPGTFVHDPKSNGNCWAWLSGNHGADSALYVSVKGGAPVLIARGAAEFYIIQDGVVYCRDETIYAYLFGDTRTYVLSETGVRAQLLTAEGGYVLWRDVTDESAPLYKYMKVD